MCLLVRRTPLLNTASKDSGHMKQRTMTFLDVKVRSPCMNKGIIIILVLHSLFCIVKCISVTVLHCAGYAGYI